MKIRLKVLLSFTLCITFIISMMPGIIANAVTNDFTPMSDVVFDFNDGTTMGWGYGWGDAVLGKNASSVYNSTVLSNSLAAKVKFTGGGWEEANLQAFISGKSTVKTNLSGFESVQYDLYIPDPKSFTGSISLETAFNESWDEFGKWSDYDISKQPVVTIAGVEYAKIHKSESMVNVTDKTNKGQLTVRIVGKNSTFSGELYLDNVVIVKTPFIKSKIFDFEDGTTMGWAKGWGEGFGSVPVENSIDITQGSNKAALKVNLKYTGGGWEEANIQTMMDGSGAKFDLTAFDRIEYDLYMPSPANFTGSLKIRTALNEAWNELGADWVTADFAKAEKVVISGKEYAKIHITDSLSTVKEKLASSQLTIRLIGCNSKYVGFVYLDNIAIIASNKVIINLDSPVKYDKLEGKATVSCKIPVPTGISLKSVTFKSDSGTTNEMLKDTDEKYKCTWDTTKEKEGFQGYTISAVTSDLNKAIMQSEVYIKNSKTEVSILSPKFDQPMSGIDNVAVAVKTASDQSISESLLSIIGSTNEYKSEFTMAKGKDGNYNVNLKALLLNAGTYIFKVSAVDSAGFTTTAYSEAYIKSSNTAKAFVRKKGTQFALNDIPYYFSGWNTYDLSYKDDYTLSTNDKGVIYTAKGEEIGILVPNGTKVKYQEQIDRQMFEAKKLGMNVIRLWGFNTDTSSAHSFYKVDSKGKWVINEDQFKEFDYVMDSAKRYEIKVMITLSNYWNDLGGINAIAQYLGLGCKLEFFSNSAAKDLYKEYMKYFANRVNTVNKIKYKDDPTIFSWDLMNEPRMDYSDDNTKDKHLYDATGKKLGEWINEMAGYIKSIDRNHMVSPGGEAHGFKNHSEYLGENWARTNEGMGQDPIKVMAQPNIDFVTFHPYPNSDWCKYSLEETQNLIKGIAFDAKMYNKALVMQEWGISKRQALKDPSNKNAEVKVSDPGYDALRLKWNKEVLKTFYEAGGNGWNIWAMQVNQAEAEFSMSSYIQSAEVIKDKPFVDILKEYGDMMNAKNRK